MLLRIIGPLLVALQLTGCVTEPKQILQTQVPNAALSNWYNPIKKPSRDTL